VPLAPALSDEDRQVVDNVAKLISFLSGGSLAGSSNGGGASSALLLELLPVLPAVAREVLPQVSAQLLSRVSARAVRELYA
jgi:aarF domain-containing kinase